MSQKRQQEESGGGGGGGSGSGSGGGGAGEPGGSSSVMISSSPLPYRPGQSKRSRVPLRDVIMEVMRNTSMEKFFLAIEPLIRRVVKEEIESAFANHASMMSSATDALPCKSKNLQLQFLTKLSLPIFTGSKIEGEGSLSITIALVDTLTRQVVASGKESQMKVEIVVLDGNFEGGEDDDWTNQEFNNNIVKEREGKRPLISGDVFVALIDGVGTVGELSFTDNSSWTRSRKFRLGARTEDGCFDGIRVREAKTESFVVKDHRGELYKKHHPPFLEDEVWRLEKIGKDGAFHKRLNMESIRTVKDFLTLLHLDGPRLRKILGGGMSTKMWEATVDHAETCVLTDQVHFYYPDGVSKAGVVFNVVGEVRGSISDKFVVIDDLTEKEKSEARAAVKQAYEQWKNVFTCDNELLVQNHLQQFNMGSPSLHEDQYNQFPMQVSTDGLGLSHSTLPSPDIFSMEPSSSLDPCVLETEESNENRCQLETPQLGGHEVPQESETLDKFSLVCEDCSQSPFSDIYCNPVDPSMSFDTQDLGAPLKGFTATIWKPKAAYRGWRTLSHVLGWIFYTKRIVARRKKLMPPPDSYPQIIAATALDIQGLHKTSKPQVSMVKKANVTKTRMAGALDNISYSFLDDTDLGGGCQDKGDTLPSALEVAATVVANIVVPAPEPQAVAQMELGGVSETFSFLNESEGRLAVDDEALKEKVNELEKEIGESQQPLEEKLTTTVQSTIEGIEKDDDKASGARDDPSSSTFPPMQGDFSPKEFEEKMKGLSSEVLSQVSTGWAYRTLILDTILRDRLKEQLESSRKVSGQMADLEGENKKLAQIIKGLEAQQNADKQAVEALRADKTDLLSKFAALTKETQGLTQKVKFLELEKQSFSTKVATLTAAMSNQETALEGLQKAMEDGDSRIEDLEQQLRTCQAELAEKDKIVSDLRAELQKQVTFSLNQNKLIKGSGLAVWKTYDEALRQFGAEPFPFPDDGRIEDFFDWIGQELASLPDIISKVGDYAASLSCESLLKILDGLKCEHINVLGTRAFQFPKDAGVKDCSPTIECIRNRFLLELWIARGREAARMAAAERLAKSKLEEDGDGCTLAQPQSES